MRLALGLGAVFGSSALLIALFVSADTPTKGAPSKAPDTSSSTQPPPAQSGSPKAKKSSPLERVPLWAEAPKLAADREPRVVVNRVVAVVGREIITLTALRRRTAPIVRAFAAMPVAQQIEMTRKAEKDTLEEMIDDVLIANVAAKRAIKIDDSEVDAAVEKVQSTNNLTHEALLKAVADSHETEEEYRADLRREMLRYKFVQTVIAPRTIARPGLTAEQWSKLLVDELMVWSAEQRAEVFVEVRL